MSYNVHNLLHLVDEVRRCGPLDNYSTFPYENMLGFLKKLPKTGYLPLEQGVNRYLEQLKLNIQAYKNVLESKGINNFFFITFLYIEFMVFFIFLYRKISGNN